MKCHFLFLLLVFFSALSGTERHIALVVRPEFRGESAFAYRLKSACKNIHWKADIIDVTKATIFKKKYDFVINLSPGSYKFPNCNNYLAIFHPTHHYFDGEGHLISEYRSYDGYLLAYSPQSYVNESKDFINGHPLSSMQWYPTVQKQKFKKVDPLYLFHICCHWGNRINGEFLQLLNFLDKQSYTRFYGSPTVQQLYPQSYLGEIPYEGNALFKLASKAGISLVIHSEDHNKYGVPSGRIFEAAAASTVIICDQNAFVQKHFGDSVLYIDTKANAFSVFNQIEDHMNWIRTNKSAALKKAKKAYAIYRKKFLLEDQLLRLEEFHNNL